MSRVVVPQLRKRTTKDGELYFTKTGNWDVYEGFEKVEEGVEK